MDVIVRVAWFAGGIVLVLTALDSAVRTFVLPRGAVVAYTRLVFIVLRRVLFDTRVRFARSYERRDRIMALYAPTGLLVLPATWLVLVVFGYTAMFRALEVDTWRNAFRTSGSSLLTLGFTVPDSLPSAVLAFTEAAIGLGLLALLISYLPTIYNAFSRREALVARLAVRAGTPPSPTELLVRTHRIGEGALDDLWESWQQWFAEVEETHTSLAVLVFFRSPQPDRSWITAAGAVLDTASLVNSTLDGPRSPQAALCVRAGYVALRSIGDFYDVRYDPDPSPTDAISVAREEFDAVCAALEEAGVPLKPDRDQAWRDFAGWRVNYDTVLLALAALTVAPYAPWSSDRSIRHRVRALPRRRRRA